MRICAALPCSACMRCMRRGWRFASPQLESVVSSLLVGAGGSPCASHALSNLYKKMSMSSVAVPLNVGILMRFVVSVMMLV